MKLLQSLLGPLCLVLLVGPVPSQAVPGGAIEQARLLASDGLVGDCFGFSVAVQGDLAAVGAPYHGSADEGAVYVFVRTHGMWMESARITANDATYFGASVALDGDRVVVGAYREDFYRGAAYVFVRSGTTWSEEAKLTPDSSGPVRYGWSVALAGDTCAVGSLEYPSGGAVFVYTREGSAWLLQERLDAPSNQAGGDFGISCALEDGTLLVGAREGLPTMSNGGSVFVYDRRASDWALTARVNAPDAAAGAYFGWAVDIDHDRIAVGAVERELHGSPLGPYPGPGSAYLFARDGESWSCEAKLTAGDGALGDDFGHSVALEGGLLAAGAPYRWTGPLMTGAAYLFEQEGTGWVQTALTTPSVPFQANDHGQSVALDGVTLLVGTPSQPHATTDPGAVYAYLLAPAPVSYCTGKTTSAGCVPFLTTSGLASATASQPFVIQGNDLVPGEAGFVIYSMRKANLAFHGGKLCVKAPISRFLPAKVAKSLGPPPCDGVLARDFNTRIQSRTDPLLTAGAAVAAQIRQRDPADPSGFGDTLTDGVAFTIAP